MRVGIAAIHVAQNLGGHQPAIPELVAFLETEFQIAVADAEIVPADLDSIKAIVGYVETKLAA